MPTLQKRIERAFESEDYIKKSKALSFLAHPDKKFAKMEPLWSHLDSDPEKVRELVVQLKDLTEPKQKSITDECIQAGITEYFKGIPSTDLVEFSKRQWDKLANKHGYRFLQPFTRSRFFLPSDQLFTFQDIQHNLGPYCSVFKMPLINHKDTCDHVFTCVYNAPLKIRAYYSTKAQRFYLFIIASILVQLCTQSLLVLPWPYITQGLIFFCTYLRGYLIGNEMVRFVSRGLLWLKAMGTGSQQSIVQKKMEKEKYIKVIEKLKKHHQKKQKLKDRLSKNERMERKLDTQSTTREIKINLLQKRLDIIAELQEMMKNNPLTDDEKKEISPALESVVKKLQKKRTVKKLYKTMDVRNVFFSIKQGMLEMIFMTKSKNIAYMIRGKELMKMQMVDKGCVGLPIDDSVKNRLQPLRAFCDGGFIKDLEAEVGYYSFQDKFFEFCRLKLPAVFFKIHDTSVVMKIIHALITAELLWALSLWAPSVFGLTSIFWMSMIPWDAGLMVIINSLWFSAPKSLSSYSWMMSRREKQERMDEVMSDFKMDHSLPICSFGWKRGIWYTHSPIHTDPDLVKKSKFFNAAG